MPATYLTVKEAARQVGKSPSSIRRAIYPILHDDNHPDRGHIQPGVEEALLLRTRGESFAWRVSEELLRRTIPIDTGSQPGSGGSAAKGPGSHGDGELLAMLRRELEIKNQQIAEQSEMMNKQMDLISGLSERLKEGNILIAGLQQRLALSDGRDKSAANTIDAKTVTPTRVGKGTATPPKSAKPDKPPATAKPATPTQGFFSRLFR
jgi:hypothetical protein